MEEEKLKELMRALARAEAQLGAKIRVCTNATRMMDLVQVRSKANRILALYGEYGDLSLAMIQLAERIIEATNEKEKVKA